MGIVESARRLLAEDGGVGRLEHVSVVMATIVRDARGQLLLDLDRPLVRRSRGEADDITVCLTDEDVLWSFERVVDRFVDLCAGSTTENRSPGELGARVVEVLDAMYRSAASGRPEDVASVR